MSAFAVRAENVSMSYPRLSRAMLDLKGLAANPLRWGELLGDGPPVLSGVSLEVRPGRGLAVLGANGAGKSTLLALLAGVLRPRAGRVETRGRVIPLLERVAGFERELSGRENAVLLGSLLGARPGEVEARLERIAKDSGLGPAFDSAQKTYSLGMSVRLGLATAAALEPDVLIVDDHLAAADARFQAERRARLDGRARGEALILATHSLKVATDLCDDALWLEDGRVRAYGPAAEIAGAYGRACEAA